MLKQLEHIPKERMKRSKAHFGQSSDRPLSGVDGRYLVPAKPTPADAGTIMPVSCVEQTVSDIRLSLDDS